MQTVGSPTAKWCMMDELFVIQKDHTSLCSWFWVLDAMIEGPLLCFLIYRLHPHCSSYILYWVCLGFTLYLGKSILFSITKHGTFMWHLYCIAQLIQYKQFIKNIFYQSRWWNTYCGMNLFELLTVFRQFLCEIKFYYSFLATLLT